MLILQNTSHYPASLADLAFVTVQGVRVGTFIVLTLLYFGLRSNKKGRTSGDPEQQPLLRKCRGTNESNRELVANSTAYNTAIDITLDSDTTEDGDAAAKDVWLSSEQKVKEKIFKRLKQDGNWITYVKGFSVRMSPPSCFAAYLHEMLDIPSLCMAHAQ